MPLGMRRTAASQRGNLAARLLPLATTLLATLLSLEPLHLPGQLSLAPAYLLMAVYHWTIYRPDLLPPIGLFAIGLVYDLLSGGPPGVTPLVLLLSRAAVLRCRRWFVDLAFLFVWAGFAALTGCAALGLWAVHSALALHFVDPQAALLRAALTISLFPIASFLLGRSQNAVLGAG